MKKLICILSFASAIFFNSCTGYQCHKLEFVDSFASVQKNILAFDSILMASNAKCNAYYDVILTQGSPLVKDRSKDSTFILKDFCDLSIKQKNKISRLSKFLIKNHIDAIFSRNGVYVYNFIYCNENNDYRYIRYIAIDKDSARYKLNTGLRIVDAQENLILSATE